MTDLLTQDCPHSPNHCCCQRRDSQQRHYWCTLWLLWTLNLIRVPPGVSQQEDRGADGVLSLELVSIVTSNWIWSGRRDDCQQEVGIIRCE